MSEPLCEAGCKWTEQSDTGPSSQSKDTESEYQLIGFHDSPLPGQGMLLPNEMAFCCKRLEKMRSAREPLHKFSAFGSSNARLDGGSYM